MCIETVDKVKKIITTSYKRDYYKRGRESAYKVIEKKILAEKLLLDSNGDVPKDYKLWVFNGKVIFVNVHYKEDNKTKINIYNMEWELQEFGMVYENNQNTLHKKPKNLDKMIKFAEEFAKDRQFLRVDFYEVDDELYIGELTLYPTSGFITFFPNHKDIDKIYGDLLDI